MHYRLVTSYSSIKILMVNKSFVPKQNCNFLISPNNNGLEGQISEAVAKVSTLQSQFVALQPKMITYENSVASFTTAVRFLTGPTAMAASFIAIGLRHVDIVQWTTQRARLYAACLKSPIWLSAQQFTVCQKELFSY
ncbi:hypothetical protein F0562_023415 [Nyssa sinensis]|uniref:Uncharacterized protein n=1 Tax=Nyssa sinensis TaxID=561372 RepID=A0A5J5BI66_9ASTE|nr:hypothetical protein F0562_023415 [Nyssa sinensis]